MDFELLYRQDGPTGIIEAAVLVLLENGIRKVYSKNRNDVTVMSVLYIFSRERIANAIANLCNNEIISVDYKTREMSYTSVFHRLLSISKGIYFVEDGNSENLVKDFCKKCEIVRGKEPKISFVLPLRCVNLRLV